ncbi:MAG: magnesium transporter [Verrucomicrobiota bacterium]|nr:magnesium transporter [Verrucomicrobiota bacterium]
MDNLATIFSGDLQQLHPADIADRIQRMPLDQVADILRTLPAPLAGEALAELEDEIKAELLQEFSELELADLFQKLEHNDTTDLLGELDDSLQRTVLEQLPDDVSVPVQALLQYEEDTAGGIMSDRFIALAMDETIESSQQQLRRTAQFSTEDISYLYVVDHDQRLRGVASFRDLVFGSPHKKVADIMQESVTFLRVTDDQEEISRQFAHYHYLALPVLDQQDRVVGVVKASDVLEIAREEATEDMQLMVGLSGEERVLTPWRKSLPGRLPWLYVNLVTAFAAAAVIAFYESTIAHWTALAIFLPVVAGQGGNAGMQTLTVIIRDMALGEITRGDGRRALLKELFLGIANGLAIGLAVGLVAYLWKGSIALSLVACSAMILTHLVAGLAGVMIPFSLKFLKVDPAMASSIFITTITDLAGFLFFLGFATMAMRWLGVVP